MIYYFLALLAAGIILLGNDPRSESNRWAAFFLWCAAIGGWTDYAADAGYPQAAGLIRFLNQSLTPYGVLVFSMVYSNRYPRRRQRTRLKWLLLLPVVLSAVFERFDPFPGVNEWLLLAWAAPYYLVSCGWLTAAFWQERDRRKKRSRFIVAVIVVPTLLAALGFIYVAQAAWPGFDFFRYVSLFLIYSLSVAVLCTFLYGVLGVKLRFEKDPLDRALEAVSSGTAILNHTIKNEIGKIAISSENLRSAIPDSDGTASEHLRIIEGASEHLMAMVDRIHGQTKELSLRESPCRLDELALECVARHRPLLDDAGIRIRTEFGVRPVVLCDEVHLKEAVGNLLRNAVEAMPEGGEIGIAIRRAKSGVELAVRDGGPGIPADRLSQAFEPFYSTKRGSRNFGLGLTYVYNVMRKSGGSAELSRAAGGGTVATLRFPRKKVIRDGEKEGAP